MKQIRQSDVVELLRKHIGERTQREVAEEFGITAQYLSDVLLGRREPGPAVLQGLGLEKDVLYVPLNGK